MIATKSRIALTVLITLATLIGMVPYVFFVRLDYWLPLFAIIVAPSAWFELKKFDNTSSEKPSTGEILLGSWGTMSNGAMASLFGLAAYFVIWGIGALVDLEAHSVAFWVSLLLVIFFSWIAAILSGEQLPAKLYPSSAGSSSVYYALLVERWKLIRMTVLSIIILAALLLFLDLHGPVLASLLTVFLLATSLPIDSLEHGEGSSPGKAKALEIVSQSLESAGYGVVLTPRTGREDIDPLVATVDLLAQSGNKVLAIEVKSGTHRPDSVEWREAAALRMGARAFEQVMNEADEGPIEVQPLMVLIDRERSEGFDQFLIDKNLLVRELTLRDNEEALSEAELANIAKTLLGAQPIVHPEAGAA